MTSCSCKRTSQLKYIEPLRKFQRPVQPAILPGRETLPKSQLGRLDLCRIQEKVIPLRRLPTSANTSQHRTVLVWLLIAQMVYIKIGVICDTCESYRQIPLPSPKGLWDARTRSSWQSENEVYKAMPRVGMESFGDLIDACKHSDSRSNKLKLDAWNTTVDNLGILLSLGASILNF
jgi:hypothetical protein